MTRKLRTRSEWRSWDWKPAGLLLIFAVVVLIAAAFTGFSMWMLP